MPTVVNTHNLGVRCVAQLSGTLSDHVKYGLDIGRGTGNHAQDLTRGRLLLQSLFDLVEQANILNSDYSLIGKGFQEGDMFF